MIGGTGPQGGPTPVTVEFNQWYEVHQAALKYLSGNFGERDAIEFAYFCGRGSVAKPEGFPFLMADRFPPLVAADNKQQLRQELWAKVYATALASGNQLRSDRPTSEADNALEAFDKRFPK